MKLLYTRYLNNNLIGARIVEGEKASLKYLNYLSKRLPEDLLIYIENDLKIKENMYLYEISFINKAGNNIKHRYELFEEVK